MSRRFEPSETIDRICRAARPAAARARARGGAAEAARSGGAARPPRRAPAASDRGPARPARAPADARGDDRLELRPARPRRRRRSSRRLAVFAGSFSLDAAEDASPSADLDGLERLVDASLMKPTGESRFLLLETIREFAGSRLGDDGAGSGRAAPRRVLPRARGAARAGADRARRAGRARAARRGPREPACRARLRSELADELVRLTTALWRFWLVRGHFHEAQTRIETGARARARRRAPRRRPLPVRRDPDLARDRASRASRPASRRSSCYRAAGQPARRGPGADGARALDRRPRRVGAGARATTREAIELSRELGDELGVAGVLGDLAGLLVREGKAEEALPIAAESVEVQRRLGFEQGMTVVPDDAGLRVPDDRRPRAGAGAAGREHASRPSRRLPARARLLPERPRLARLRDGTSSTARRRPSRRPSGCARDIGIDHDPDDALIAPVRAALEAKLGVPLDGSAVGGARPRRGRRGSDRGRRARTQVRTVGPRALRAGLL